MWNLGNFLWVFAIMKLNKKTTNVILIITLIFLIGVVGFFLKTKTLGNSILSVTPN